MSESKKMDDLEVAAISSAAIIVASGVFYWFLEFVSTVELLELAYGSVKFFNNPLVF